MNNKRNDISERQNEILQFIIRKVKESGYPPTIREIATAVRLSSSATIHAHLKKLEQYGYIRRDPTKPRAIELNPDLINTDEEKKSDESNTVFVPVVGKIAAGFNSVTHCYARTGFPGWPYNLYTMIHGKTKDECYGIARKISDASGIEEYDLLFTTRELKKTSFNPGIDNNSE